MPMVMRDGRHIKMRIPLLSASYQAASKKAAVQRCVNLYPEVNPTDSPAPTTFYGTPGLLLWDALPGSGQVRCMYKSSSGTLFAVQGNKLYRYSSGSWTSVSTFSTDTGVVKAADNGISAVFVDGTTTAPTVSLSTYASSYMSGDGWLGADFVGYLDGFFVFNKPSSQIFYISGALDLTVDALDFASAESNPDLLVSFIIDHEEIIFLGVESTEVFSNTGNQDFPFERRGGATMEVGCVAKHSVAKLDNSIVWLGNDERGDCTVWRMQGYQPVRISDFGMENALRSYTTISDAQAYSYQINGHSFYQITFPTESKTWQYDAASGKWIEIVCRDSDNNYLRHRSNCHVFFERKHLVGDFENGNIYQLDLDTYTDNGSPIPRIKTFAHMVSNGKRQFFNSLELDMEVGVGNSDDPDPQVSLRWSDDGGNTWSSTLTRSIGKVGEYSKRVKFNRLGSGYDRIFEVATTAKCKIALQGAFVDVT
jgi:hypothetical protein